MINNEIVWHYTTGENFIKIVEDGFLKPTSIGIKGKEKPILWFSSHPYFEPTACKAKIINGSIQRLTMKETFIAGGGLVRLGMPLSSLTRWPQLHRDALMPRKIARILERSGKEQGAKPSQWYGLIDIPLDIGECVSIQAINGDVQWVEVLNECN